MTKPHPQDGRKDKPEQGIVRDNKGQEQPADKERARQVGRTDRGDDPPGEKTEKK